MPTRIAFFGPPGAGKGTQARLIGKRFGLCHISTGNLLRDAVKKLTPVGQKVREYMAAGQLVPDSVVCNLAKESIAKQGNDRFVLDGYPRTLQQAKWLTTYLAKKNAPLNIVISFTLSEDAMVDRLSKRRVHKITGENFHLDHKPPVGIDPDMIMQRRDDKPDAMLHRLQVYTEQAHPVESYYRDQKILFEVSAEDSISAVHECVVTMLQRESR